jgi:hypothetical protein
MPTDFCHLVTSIRPYVQLWHSLCGLLMDARYTKIESNVNNAGEKKLICWIQRRLSFYIQVI